MKKITITSEHESAIVTMWQAGKSMYSILKEVGLPRSQEETFKAILEKNGLEYIKRPKSIEGTKGMSPKETHRYISDRGYVIMMVPYDHWLRPYTTRGLMPEHRFVIAEKLGRALEPSETIHHINGDRTDNRLENLQLRTGNHGKGAKGECLDCGSVNVRFLPI